MKGSIVDYYCEFQYHLEDISTIEINEFNLESSQLSNSNYLHLLVFIGHHTDYK